MDRGTNLEALAEEEDEESWETEEEDYEQGDGGVKKGEPNKFDSLCDGVHTHMSLTRNALGELLELKDELLKHSLPPNVLTRIALCTAKVFRAESDLHMPVNELLRLVRIYSTPWEEKSAALKKLHDDYESKKNQLSIAIKRLQLVDAHSKRMGHEKRIMNWEKLFCKLTTARGHGRRWKFLIGAFKKKASQGIESLQEYLHSMDTMADSDSDNEVDMKEIETQMQQLAPSVSAQTDQMSSDEESEDDEETVSEHKLELQLEPDKVSEPVVAIIKPPMKDQKVWTHEPEFARSLHVRVFKPVGLDYRELRCVLTCGNQFHRTAPLDLLDAELEEEGQTEPSAETQLPSDTRRPMRGRGRGLMGLRGARAAAVPAGRPGTIKTAQDAASKDGKKDGADKPRYEECIFKLPDDKPKGIWNQDGRREAMPEHIQIAVHFGPKDEMVAMATIDMDDLDGLDLPSLFMPSVEGANEHAMELYRKSEAYESGTVISPDPVQDINKLDPLNFPLYSVHAGKSDSVHRPCGQLPLVCYWAKTLKPTSFHKNTEAQTVHDIILEETGFDMHEVTKEDLHPELMERSISAASFASSAPKEETVPRMEYDRLMQIHREEMELLQEEYEQRLQDLAESVQEMQTAQLSVQRTRSPPATHRSKSPRPPSTSPTDQHHSLPPAQETHHQSRPKQRQVPKTFKVGHALPNWGENLPANFFDRLRLFEEKSQQHMREIAEKQGRETSDTIQKKLASEYKLNPNDPDDDLTNALQDVSLPAVFLPTKSRDLSIFNPRAHQYFHASGSSGTRLTQPPSMVQLPPLPKNRLSVVNLFDLSQNFRGGGRDVMLQQYLQQQQGSRPLSGTSLPGRSPMMDSSAYPTSAPKSHSAMPTRDPTMVAMTTGPHAQREAMLD